MNLRPILLLLVSLPLLAAPTAAQGLVQLTLSGALSEPGGGRVQVAVEARVGDQVRRAALDLHLAQGTDAHALAALLAERAQALELPLLYPGAGADPGAGVSLFFGQALRLEARLPAGLHGRLVACDGPPSAVRFLPPRPRAAGEQAPTTRLVLAVTTRHPVTGVEGSERVELDLPADGSAARASERLFTRTVEAGWTADRPSNDAWRPLRVDDSSLVRGLSVEILRSGHGWGLALELEDAGQ